MKLLTIGGVGLCLLALLVAGDWAVAQALIHAHHVTTPGAIAAVAAMILVTGFLLVALVFTLAEWSDEWR